MNIGLAGGTGFIGQALTNHFTSLGHHVYILTRTPKENKEKITYIKWLTQNATPEKNLPELHVFINLAGDSIGSGRWTEKKKERILNSRIQATTASIDLVNKMPTRPRLFMNASAIGYYGHSLTTTFTEEQTSGGQNNFLQDVVHQWENAVLGKLSKETRVVLPRFGLVLDKSEGALAKMLLPYRFFIGGPIGSGKQWYSWIHIEDVVRLFEFIMEHEDIHGPINFTAPHPVQMSEMGRTIAKELHRPHYLPTPAFAFRLLLGEMSSLLLEGQNVLPEKAIQNGFTFKYSTIDQAIQNILS